MDDKLKAQMMRIIENNQEQVWQLNDSLADAPEISGAEYRSSEKIVNLLRANRIEVEYPFAGFPTAFRGRINVGKKHKAVILAEYDALQGLGHACGHCASASISVLTALVLQELGETLNAEIDIIGTPDEEQNGIKIYMAEQDIFSAYDLAVMIHMGNQNLVTVNLLALDMFDIRFTGKAAHAAKAPWEGRNALNAARLFFDAVDMMRQHVRPDVRMHGYIRDGGQAKNIVPEAADILFCTRSLERAYLDDVTMWVKDCAKAAALATRTKVEIQQIGRSYAGMKHNLAGEKQLEAIFIEKGLQLSEASCETFSSDIGNLSFLLPSFHPLLSIGEPFDLHTREFAACMKTDKTHRAISKGAEIIVQFLSDIFMGPNLLPEIKSDFNFSKMYRK